MPYYKIALVFGTAIMLIPFLVPGISAHKDVGKNWVNDWVHMEIKNKGKKIDAVQIIFQDIKKEKHNHWSSTYSKTLGVLKKGETVIVNLPSHKEVGKGPECTPAANYQLKFIVIFKSNGTYYGTRNFVISLADEPVTGSIKTPKDKGSANLEYKFIREENVLNLCGKKLDTSKLKTPDKKSTAKPLQITKLTYEKFKFDLGTSISSGSISRTVVDPTTKSLTLYLNGTDKGGRLLVTLPREVIDSKIGDADGRFTASANSKKTDSFEVDRSKTSRMIVVPFEKGTKEIGITGTTVVPEFPFGIMLVLVTVMATIIALTRINRMRIKE